MESNSKNNNNYIFYEDIDDKVKGYPESRFYSANNTPFYGNRTNSSSDEGLDENSNNLFKMKLRSTVADSKFIEQSATNLKSKIKKENNNTENFRPEDIFDLGFNDGNYSTNVDSDSKGFDDRSFNNMGSFDKKMNRYSTNGSFETDMYKEDDMYFDVDPFIEKTNVGYNVYHENKVTSRTHKHNSSDLASSLRDIANRIEFNDFKYNSRKNKYEDRIAYLTNKVTNLKGERDTIYKNLHLALKETELIKEKLENRIVELESHVRQLTLMIRENGNELMSDSCIDNNDMNSTSTNKDRSNNSSNNNQNNSSDNSYSNISNNNTNYNKDNNNNYVASTTLPSITIEYNELDEKSKNFVNKLMKYLYADINESESSMFIPNLYKSLKEMNRVLESRTLVNYIHECISKDAKMIQSVNKNISVSEDDLYTDSGLGVPQSNMERQVIAELESTLHVSSGNDSSNFIRKQQQNGGIRVDYGPLPKFRNDWSQNNLDFSNNSNSNQSNTSNNYGNYYNYNKMMSDEFSCLKTHLIMNRSVLLAIFKASNMNNLYNYLFEALKSDNFRVVEIINQSVCLKFMDFMMSGSFISKVRHPIMWAFGPDSNGIQAFRYIKMLNYNFSTMPTDPTTGDNLWHMVAKSNCVFLAQKLKSFSVYTPYLNTLNNDGKTALSICSIPIKREFYVNLIVDLASKGSEMYKKSIYDKALEYYTDSIELQSQLISDQVLDSTGQGLNSSRSNSPSNKDNNSSSSGRDSKGNRIGGKYAYNDAFSSSVESRNDRNRDGYRREGRDGINNNNNMNSSNNTNKDNYYLNMGKLYYNKARTLMHLDRWMESIENCELCLKYIPNYNNAYDTCIRAYENLLDWNNAASTCIAMKESCGIMDDIRYQFIIDQRDATYFQLLDLDINATPADIKKAFNSMCKIWHPDKIPPNLSEDFKKRCINHFNRLFEAREKLMDPGTRALQQLKRETNYKIPTTYLNQDKQNEDSLNNNKERYRKESKEIYKESSIEVEFKESKEKIKNEQEKESINENIKRNQKNIETKDIKSRDNLNELVNERLKFMDSMNLLKGQATFDYDSFSWGQL